VTEEQLTSAKSYIKGQFPPNIETSKQLAHIIATYEFYGLSDDEINQLEARVDAVTPEMAKAVIQKHFPAGEFGVGADWEGFGDWGGGGEVWEKRMRGRLLRRGFGRRRSRRNEFAALRILDEPA